MTEKLIQGLSDGDCARRITPLIIHDLQNLAGAIRKRKHLIEEARAAGTVKPGDAGNNVVRAVCSHGLLGRPFALTVYTVPPCWSIEFRIGNGRIALKHIIC